MNRIKALSYLFIIVVVVQIGLWFPIDNLTTKLVQIDSEYADVSLKLEKFKTFEDSLIGNLGFRKRILDTVTTVNELKQIRTHQREELKRKLDEFAILSSSRQGLVKRLKFYESARILIDMLFFCLGLFLIIKLFGRR